MICETEKMEKAETVLIKIAKGIDPLTGETIKGDSFLNDPRIIRCLYFVTEVLEKVKDGSYSRNNKLQNFVISQDQKNLVSLPEGKIGVNEFSKQINTCIDPSASKKLTGMELNRRLKKMGILSEEVNPATGKTRTGINPNSEKYGFESVKKSFNNTEYEMVVMNDKGKQYILDHLEEIMSMEV